jgi:hypothetical protein
MFLLDAQAGVQWEGEDTPNVTDLDRQAVKVFNATANGMGGVQWTALPLFVALYGVQDIEGLIDRLLVLLQHRPTTAS